ncbi:hypothetical protein U5801_00855 [Lamprobacter modestohalophilus]|uniref:hypothetical protein n=1 Tax=Lamprobacter modestohalophilus TaxID=1064514 RepID=UPI002ADEB1F1|nr:hypothetical protein [Lamprobacter modestohalophilus]MEA1048372.1 hypothetical protein [Lamprobacter modestohalophilus]
MAFSLVACFSSMGPWATVFGTTVNGSKGDGWVVLFLMIILIITMLFGNLKKSIGIVKAITNTIFSALAAAIGVYTIYNAVDTFRHFNGDSWSIEWGLPVMVLSTIGISVISFLMRDNKEKNLLRK